MQGVEGEWAPRLTLYPDSTFTFSYNLLSSYLPYGTYSLSDGSLFCETEDGRYHYVFLPLEDGGYELSASESSPLIVPYPEYQTVDGRIFR